MIWNYVFKSTLFRNELKHWALIISLFVWAVFATAMAVVRKDKVVLVTLDKDGFARIITDTNDLLLKKEMGAFINHFLSLYYGYSDKDFLNRIGDATDLMTDELWLQKKEDLVKISEDLKAMPLIQEVKVLSIDLVSENKLEAELELSITTRLQATKARLRVEVELKHAPRTLKHPWGYQIAGLVEHVL